MHKDFRHLQSVTPLPLTLPLTLPARLEPKQHVLVRSSPLAQRDHTIEMDLDLTGPAAPSFVALPCLQLYSLSASFSLTAALVCDGSGLRFPVALERVRAFGVRRPF